MSYLHNCSQYRLVKRAYCADLVQALGWGAAIEDKLNPLGQSLAFLDEFFDCSLATSQLQMSAQEAVMQPNDSHPMQQYFVYKSDVGLEKYLQQIDSFQLRCSLTRFRSGQHWLQCRRGRFHGLPYEARVCNACVQHVDSEHHALSDCPKYELARFVLLILLGELMLWLSDHPQSPCEDCTFLARVPRVGRFPLS